MTWINVLGGVAGFAVGVGAHLVSAWAHVRMRRVLSSVLLVELLYLLTFLVLTGAGLIPLTAHGATPAVVVLSYALGLAVIRRARGEI